MFFQISKSTSNLQEITFSGRPRGEDPHVKRSIKRKQEHVEYIVRVDLVSIIIKLYYEYFQTDNTLNRWMLCQDTQKCFMSFLLQDELKIDDDQFEDLQSLYQLFDIDRDGILSFKEYEKLLRCLGYRLNGKKTTKSASQVSFCFVSHLFTYCMIYIYRQL